MSLSLEELIISHINYRDVFNAPVAKKDLGRWVGVSGDNMGINSLFAEIISDLESANLISVRNNYLCVKGREDLIESQMVKTVLSQEILEKGKVFFKRLSKIPFVRFIGVSGSVAAANPTPNERDHVDLDIFMICRSHSLWVFYIFERIFSNIVRIRKGDHFYCFNYSTEDSFLEIHNESFYTATEMVNLLPIYDDGIYDQFLNHNLWYEKYYDSKSISRSNPSNISGPNGKPTNILLRIINSSFYLLFCFIRTLKRLSLVGIRDFNTSFNPSVRHNLKRVSSPYGGFQNEVKKRFDHLLLKNFPRFYSENIVNYLFPDFEGVIAESAGKTESDNEIHMLFSKYVNEKHEENTI